ncbi:MAG TPA: serine/threonine-protein kinase, partial [Polyangiaceae bacterium]
MVDTLVTRSSHDEVLERDVGASAGFGLPRELLEKARGRLRVILMLALFGGFLSLIVRSSRALESDLAFEREAIGVAYAALVALSSALFLGLSYLRRESPGFALRLGLAFEVLLGYTIAIGNTIYVVKNHGHVPFLTWTAPLMILFPLIVPSPPKMTLLVAVLTGSSAWVSVAVVSELALLQPTLDTYLDVSVSPIVATAIAYYGARVVYGLNVDYARATRMGSYVLKSRLGAGGMGEVWRAEHQLLARPAAVKVIRRESLHELGIGEETLRGRFEREAQATALLRSPHTVELYDFGVAEDGSFFYVMELLEGLDLEKLVQKYGPMPPERVVHVMLQICASLAEAHENDLIHRDIKPANIYLCQYG